MKEFQEKKSKERVEKGHGKNKWLSEFMSDSGSAVEATLMTSYRWI